VLIYRAASAWAKKSQKRCYNSKLTGPVAQLVEQRIENPRVDGSIPSQATKIAKAHLRMGFCLQKIIPQ
jgi:hypothetical protein